MSRGVYELQAADRRSELESAVRAAEARLGYAESQDRQAELDARVHREMVREYGSRYLEEPTREPSDVPAAKLALAEARAALAEWVEGEPGWLADRAAEAREAAAIAEEEAESDPRWRADETLHGQRWDYSSSRWEQVDKWRKDAPLWQLIDDEQRATMSTIHFVALRRVVCDIDGGSEDRNWRPSHVTSAAVAVGVARFVRLCLAADLEI